MHRFAPWKMEPWYDQHRSKQNPQISDNWRSKCTINKNKTRPMTRTLMLPEVACFFLVWFGLQSRVDSELSGKWRSRRRLWRPSFSSIVRTNHASMEFKKCTCFSFVHGSFRSLGTCESMPTGSQKPKQNLIFLSFYFFFLSRGFPRNKQLVPWWVGLFTLFIFL